MIIYNWLHFSPLISFTNTINKQLLYYIVFRQFHANNSFLQEAFPLIKSLHNNSVAPQCFNNIYY